MVIIVVILWNLLMYLSDLGYAEETVLREPRRKCTRAFIEMYGGYTVKTQVSELRLETQFIELRSANISYGIVRTFVRTYTEKLLYWIISTSERKLN